MRFRDVDEAIATYAVALNRAQWIAPERRDDQRAVWSRLADREAGDGVISTDDVDEAIVALIHEQRALDVVPLLVVERAAQRARDRAARVRTMVDAVDTPEVFLLDVTSQLRRLRDSGEDMQPTIAAVVKAVRSDLMSADVDDATLTRVLSVVDATLTPFTQTAREIASHE